MRPARGDYPCKVCGRVLGSPGALGGHMAQHGESRPSVPMSGPQRALLAEIGQAGVLYVGRHMRYARTVNALAAKGLVEIAEPDYSPHGHDGWSLTEPGIEWLAASRG